MTDPASKTARTIMKGRKCPPNLALYIFLLVIFIWEINYQLTGYRSIYFGTPSDLINIYIVAPKTFCAWLWHAINAFLQGFISVICATFLSYFFLLISLQSNCLRNLVERTVLTSQIVPMQLIGLSLYILLTVIGLPATEYQYLYIVSSTAIVLLFPPFIYGLKSVDHLEYEIKSLLKVWGVGSKARILRVYLPHATPNLLVGVKIISAWAVPAVLVFQLIVGIEGLGKALIVSMRNSKPDVFLGIVVTIGIGVLLYSVFSLVQHTVEQRMIGDAAYNKQTIHWTHN